MKTVKRMALPVLLTLIGLWVLVGGCIYVPWSDKVPPGQRDARAFFGKAGSDRPLRIGTTMRDEVLRVAGYPNGVSADRLTWTYKWSAQNGGWFQPLCFRTDPAWRDYTLTLEFNADGRIKRFTVNHKVQPFPLFDGGGAFPHDTYDPADPNHPRTHAYP